MKLFRNLFLKYPPAAWLVFVLTLLVIGWAWFVASAAVQQRASERFDYTAKDVATAITERMDQYQLALRSGLALFKSSDHVSRQDWENFADTLYLNKHFPGIQGLGYSVMLHPEDVPGHEATIQQEGFPDYQVKPSGQRDMYSAIIYLEPFDWRNQRAFGYDMFSEPTRRQAMVRSRDTADFAASGRVTLVQETEQDVQYGFLMYFPHYKKNTSLTYIKERRQSILGFIYAAFRMGDLMRGVLGDTHQNIDFELYEGEPDNGVLLYNNAEDKQLRYAKGDNQNHFQTTLQIDVGGQTWSLFVYSDAGFIQASELNQPTFIVVTGLLLNIFLFFFISYLVKGRSQAKASEQQALADYKQSQQRLQLAADAGKMGLAEWNIAEDTMYWDDRMLALYGYSRDTFPNNLHAWQQRVHPNDKLVTLNKIKEAQQFKDHFDMEFRIILPDGEVRHIAASMIIERNPTGEAMRMVGFNYDITEQNQSKQQLQAERWRLQNVLEGTNAGTWEWNIQTNETQFNKRWAEIIGYSLDEVNALSNKTWLDLVHPEDVESCTNSIQAHFAGRTEYFERNFRIQHKDGHWLWIMARGKVFAWTDAGEPLLMFGTHHDISVQKRYESILKTERDKAQSANRSRGEFLANMSHEIRTPINGVMGTLNLLADTQLTASQHNLLNISKRSADALLGLINDILDLSRIESGKLEIFEHELELLITIADVARTLSSKAESKGIELLCPSHYIEEVILFTDGLRLRQILTNLLNNALKFTEKGSVKLSIDKLDESNSKLKLRFNVTDTGQGISDKDQQLLFERFQQVDSSLTRKEGGSGLGLAICKQLVELMGGTIGFESQVGVGSRFWFELEFVKAAIKQPVTAQVFDTVKVCVLKPMPVYDELYTTVFAAWNVAYSQADEYSQVLEEFTAAAQYQHKILIIDAEQLKDKALVKALLDTKEQRKDIVLLVVCSQSMVSMIPQVISDEADQILSKPLIQSDLYNAVLAVVYDNNAVDKSLMKKEKTSLKKFDAEVLVVEDNVTNVVIIQGLLKKFNIRSKVAEDGRKALDLLAKNEYDLVLMDCQMPVMDGYETTRRIRQADSAVLNKDIAVIALTAQAMRGDEEACIRAGMNDYLTKPIEPEVLYEKLSKWLPERCKRQLAS